MAKETAPAPTLSLPNPRPRKLFFGKQVDQESIEAISKEIIFINDNDKLLKRIYKIHNLKYKPKPIKIYIDSYGGFVYQIMGLISIMDNSKTPIHTIATGAAMSCGFMMLISGHKRFAYKLATPMYHQIASGFMGKVEDLEQKYVQSKRLQDLFEEITIRRTEISKDKLDQIRVEKIDWYMTADEAKELRVVDEVI